MKVEFLMKWQGDLTTEEREEIRQSRLLGEDDGDDYSARKFTYQPFTLELNLVEDFNGADDKHTAVRTENGFFILKIPYYKFKGIYEALMGFVVKSYKDFKFMEVGPQQEDDEQQEDDLIL